VINSSVSFLQCSQSGLNSIKNKGVFFFSCFSVKIVELSVNNNLRGGVVGNLLYGGSVCCAKASIETCTKIKRVITVFILQRNFIIH
jgi:hypothetical protein